MAEYALFDYHERSKHRLNRYAPAPGRLDWANQPNPFRRYEGAVRIDLPLLADDLETRYGALRRGCMPAPHAFTLDSVAIHTDLTCRYSLIASSPLSRPRPLRL